MRIVWRVSSKAQDKIDCTMLERKSAAGRGKGKAGQGYDGTISVSWCGVLLPS
jgi:hypothetical protein